MITCRAGHTFEKRTTSGHCPECRRAASRKFQRGGKSSETKAGPCEICGTHCEPLHWDHNHVTGQFRGWLCPRCNGGLGCFGDDIEVMKWAIQYLEAR